MTNNITEIKKEMEIKFAELRLKRRNIIAQFKKKLEEAKIAQIKHSVLSK